MRDLLRGNTLEAFQRGLESVGLKIEDLTEREIRDILSYALGFVDFSNPDILIDCLEDAGVEYFGRGLNTLDCMIVSVELLGN